MATTSLTNARKATMLLNAALRSEREGDTAKMEKYLDKACAAESAAIANGEMAEAA